MFKSKKIFSIILIAILSFSIVGCSGKTASNNSPDEAFIEDFSKAINKRWDEQNKLDDKYTSGSLTDEEYITETVKVLESEVETIKKNLDLIEDKDLKEAANNYINGCQKQIDANKTDDFELQTKYMEESEKLRKPALITIVDEFGAKINDEHQQTYKDFKEKAIIIEKDNEAKEFADKIAQEVVFEKHTDEYGVITYVATVENTTDISFSNISYNVQYKDSEGVVTNTDYATINNFTPGQKQNITLYPFDENFDSIVLSTDFVTTKE